MIGVLTHHWAKAEKVDQARKLLEKNGLAQSKAPGFISRVTLISLSDETKITTLVTWESSEIYDAWRASPERQAVMSGAEVLWSKLPESERFELTQTSKTFMTAKELFEMPDDDYRYELIKGELIKMSPSGIGHGKLSAKLATLLSNYVNPRQLGMVCGAETGFVLARNPDTVRAPDVSFILQERIPPEDELTRFGNFPPDLAVEVISPSDRYEEIQEKLADYFHAGVKLVWIVDPKNHTVAVYNSLSEARILAESDTLEGGDVIPGFSCSVSEIFD